MKNIFFYTLLLILPLNSIFAWPWMQPKGSFGLSTSATHYSANEKLAGSPYFSGDPQGNLTVTNFNLSSELVIQHRLALSFYTQWANIKWDKIDPDSKRGIKDTWIYLKHKLPLSIPLLLTGGLRLPTGFHSTKSNSISLGEGNTAFSLGFSTGTKPTDFLFLYTSHETGISTPSPMETGDFQKGMLYKGQVSVLGVYKVLAFSGSTEWLLSADSKRTLNNNETQILSGDSYLTTRWGVETKLFNNKIRTGVLIPLMGKNYPRANQWTVGIARSMKLF